MTTSDLRARVYSYLGFRGVGESAETDARIGEALAELDGIAQFNYLYRAFSDPPAFLTKEPYASFLAGARGVLLSVMTLGAEPDRRIRLLSRTDLAKAVVFDACASALLEAKSDEYERGIGEELSERFCPGYGGSSVRDLKEIFELLHPERIGVTLNESNFMLPSKSMAGVLGIGKRTKKSCGDCFLFPHCRFIEVGTRCYGSEKT